MKTMKYLFLWFAWAGGVTTVNAQIVLLNECNTPDDLNRFMPKMYEVRAIRNINADNSVSMPSIYDSPDIVYRSFEELVYWEGNERFFRSGIRNRETADGIVETTGKILSERGYSVITPAPAVLKLLKEGWDLEKEKITEADRLKLRNLLCENYGADTLLLLTDCSCDFRFRSWKEPGRKPKDVSGEAELTIGAVWAVYDCRSERIVSEFRTEGTAGMDRERITRGLVDELREKRFARENIRDAAERQYVDERRLKSQSTHRSHLSISETWDLKPAMPIHYGVPAIWPLVEKITGEFAETVAGHLAD